MSALQKTLLLALWVGAVTTQAETLNDQRILSSFLSAFDPALVQSDRQRSVDDLEGERPIVVMAFSLDVTGDGAPETFLGSSVAKDSSVEWKIYQSDGEAIHLLGDGVRLPPQGFFINREGHDTLLRAYQRDTQLSYSVWTYRISNAGNVSEEIAEPDGHERLFLQRGKSPPGTNLGSMIRPEIRCVLLQDLVRDAGSAKWADYNFDSSPHRQFTYIPQVEYKASLEDIHAVSVVSQEVQPIAQANEHGGGGTSRPTPDAFWKKSSEVGLLLAGVAVALLIGSFAWIKQNHG